MRSTTKSHTKVQEKGKKFYVYELRDSEGVCFYVGKGTGKRMHQHNYYARSGSVKSYVVSRIQKMMREGASYTAHKVFETDTESEALQEEVRLIAFHGRSRLTNLTDGGEGVSGLVMKPESRERMRQAKLRRRPDGYTPCHKKKITDYPLKDWDPDYLDSRFFSHIDRSGPLPDQSVHYYEGLGVCWIWRGKKSPKGFGLTSVKSLVFHVHRLSYYLHVGDIPEGMNVLHSCDNPECSNPDHLFLGTNVESAKIKVSKGRATNALHWLGRVIDRSNYKRGSGMYNASFTDDQVIDMRIRYSNGISTEHIAASYGVHVGTVARALSGATYGYLPNKQILKRGRLKKNPTTKR